MTNALSRRSFFRKPSVEEAFALLAPSILSGAKDVADEVQVRALRTQTVLEP
jgi:hypothetical protein